MSNTWVTYLRDRDNLPKGGLIPDVFSKLNCFEKKDGDLARDLSPLDGPAAYQLVGEVMAHQG